MLKRQEEELKARRAGQAAAAAAEAAQRAAAPPAPMWFNAAGELIHLHGGRSEFDDILRQTGDSSVDVRVNAGLLEANSKLTAQLAA